MGSLIEAFREVGRRDLRLVVGEDEGDNADGLRASHNPGRQALHNPGRRAWSDRVLQALRCPWLGCDDIFWPDMVSDAINDGELVTGGIPNSDGVGLGNSIGNGFSVHDQGPASAAISDGGLVTLGMRHYDGGVRRGDGVGNRFGANDQEPSSAAFNGEHSTNYVRAGDYFRDVRTENGGLHFHMNSFVNVDGRVYNLRQETYLNNPTSSQLTNKIIVAITGQASIGLMGTASKFHSSPLLPAFYFVVAATAVGFFTSMISILLRNRKPWVAGVLTKVGAIAGSSAIILAMGMALHMRYIWVFVVLCIMTAASVLLGNI